MPEVLVRRSEARVRQEAHHVLLEIDGHVTELPWQAAKQLSRALRIMAGKAEEFEKAHEIAFDQAILLRSGAPFGLTDNPDIQKEAAIEAASNPVLRRSMPGGIRSQEQLGVPTVRTEPAGGDGHV
jgi:hypothetical protein